MRVVHINVTATLSTGRIAVEICRVLSEQGHKALMAFSRGYPPTEIPWVKIGSRADVLWHAVCARLLDRAGFSGRRATQKLVRQLKAYRPDLVHLHNLHGYYLHLPTLFGFLKKTGVPVVWTLHDSWAYTGHCAYYTMAKGEASRQEGRTHRRLTTRGCGRWKSGCGHCPEKHAYPASFWMDQSARNWHEKRALMTGLPQVTLATPSHWLAREVQKSFLREYPVWVIPNGIDLNVFRPSEDAEYLEDVAKAHKLHTMGEKRLLLSVASTWDERKGMQDLWELSQCLGDDYLILLVGLTEWQREHLPEGLLGIPRTRNLKELCVLYTAADLYITLSHEETMGMTLIEAMACGTQVLCYDTTALPESVTPEVGSAVPMGNIQAVAEEVVRLCDAPKSAAACRLHAEWYDKRERFSDYVRLYEEMLGL